MNLEYFDIEKYLEARDIEFWTEGENVKQGWVNIQCLWCSDEKNHLGINLDSKGMNCWICPVKGTALKLIMKIDKCSLKSAERVVDEFSNIQTSINRSLSSTKHLTQRETQVKLPFVAQKELLPLYRKFLIKRGFEPDYVFKKYNLLCNGPIGQYKHRLIVPFYLKKRLVTFSTRDVSGKAKLPYINYPSGVLTTKETLYNIDSCVDTALVVEGFIDTWKIGDGVCATMGIQWTLEQLKLLSIFKRVFVLFDTEDRAQESAKKLCFDLSCVVNHVERLELDKGDPGDFSESDVKHLRKEIFGKIY